MKKNLNSVFIDRKVFEMGRWIKELEIKGQVYAFLLSFLRAVQTSIPSFLFSLDYLKDIILYLILRETVGRIEESCVQREYDCLAASGTEKDILTALLVKFCVSITHTSIDSFFLRKKFFKTSFWLDLIFAVLSPILPAIYHFRLNQMNLKLEKQKSKLNKDIFIRKASSLENLSNSVQLAKDVEVGFEAILQIFLLLGLVCFYPYMFKAPSGQTYSYFFGVAHIVLKGNYTLFFASLFISFLGPCWFYVKRINFLRHGSLNMSRKLDFDGSQCPLSPCSRVCHHLGHFHPCHRKLEHVHQERRHSCQLVLGNWRFHREFQKNFSKGLDRVTDDIRKNALIFGLFLFIHLALVASHGIFRSTKFSKASAKEQIIYLLSTFSHEIERNSASSPSEMVSMNMRVELA